jgi:hypothetical protein
VCLLSSRKLFIENSEALKAVLAKLLFVCVFFDPFYDSHMNNEAIDYVCKLTKLEWGKSDWKRTLIWKFMGVFVT